MMRRSFAILLLAAPCLSAACNIIIPATYIIEGPPKEPAVFELPEKRTLVFIDDPKNRMTRVALRAEVADRTERLLFDEGKVTELVSCADAIQLARRSDAQGNRASIESIGRAMNVQQVIYVVVDRFTLSVDGASPRPGATVRVKVLDLEDQTRIFPGDDNGHLVESELREPPQSMYVSTSGRRQIEDQLAMQLATDIAELFYEHEDRPLGGSLQAPRQRAQDR